MDFIRLIENGRYTLDELSKEGRAIIEGMDEIIKEVEDYEPDEIEIFGYGTEGVIGKMIQEIQFGTLSELEEKLYSKRCEAIVSLIEEEAKGESNE